MDSYYEFNLYLQHQLLETAWRAKILQDCREKRYKSWKRLFSRCGDMLIICGAWMKRVSRSPVNEKSMGIYSRN
jgi:hypothetical protein